jgi:hypothetical protein
LADRYFGSKSEQRQELLQEKKNKELRKKMSNTSSKGIKEERKRL